MKPKVFRAAFPYMLLLSFGTTAWAQSFTPLMPDRTDIVQQVAQAYPQEFWNADRPGLSEAQQKAFIRRLACVLHGIDPNFGLNGKCGTSEISGDVIAYLNPTVVWTSCTTCGAGAEAADVILGAGGPSPGAWWLNITNPAGCGSRWIQPDVTSCVMRPTIPRNLRVVR